MKFVPSGGSFLTIISYVAQNYAQRNKSASPVKAKGKVFLVHCIMKVCGTVEYAVRVPNGNKCKN